MGGGGDENVGGPLAVARGEIKKLPEGVDPGYIAPDDF